MDRFTKLFDNDGTCITSWCGIPDTQYLATVAENNFDAMTLDMQHGMQTEESIIRGIQVLAPTGKPVIVRIPVGRFDFVSKALDAGAHGIIAPMINTVEDARQFASFAKYIPLGDRSYGPTTAIANLRADRNEYVTMANQQTKTFAMIETKEAVSNMEAILDVDGIDGVFCGPADLSISVRGNIIPDVYGDDTIKIVENMGKAARDRGKIAAAFCADAKTVDMVHGLGYRFISIGFDVSYIANGANRQLAEMTFR